MADAVFIRHLLAHGEQEAGEQEAAGRALFPAGTPGFPLLSVEAPHEAALWLPDAAGNTAALPNLPGAARYDLEQVSDSGPATEPFGILMLVAFDVPQDRTDEVDRWYDEEHIRLLMKADGWLRARRYRVRSHQGAPRWTSMAFHELRDITVMASPERAIARSTQWRARLEQEPWFPAAGRGVFRPLANAS